MEYELKEQLQAFLLQYTATDKFTDSVRKKRLNSMVTSKEVDNGTFTNKPIQRYNQYTNIVNSKMARINWLAETKQDLLDINGREDTISNRKLSGTLASNHNFTEKAKKILGTEKAKR